MEFPKQQHKPPMSVPEIARAIGVHANTVLRDIHTEVLAAEKSGGQYVVAGDDAAAYIEVRSMVAKGEAALAGLRARVQERKKPHA